VVHRAAFPDGTGGYQAVQTRFARSKRNLTKRGRRLKLIWAAGAYVSIVEVLHKQFGWTLELVHIRMA